MEQALQDHAPADVPELDYQRDLGFPGEYPFTRGVQSTMYRGRLWTMRQFSGFGSADVSLLRGSNTSSVRR